MQPSGRVPTTAPTPHSRAAQPTEAFMHAAWTHYMRERVVLPSERGAASPRSPPHNDLLIMHVTLPLPKLHITPTPLATPTPPLPPLMLEWMHMGPPMLQMLPGPL